MSRMYMAPISITTAFTAQIDIFEILAGSNKPIAVHGFELGQTTEVGDAQEEQLLLILKRITGAPTSGSGGGTSTAQPLSPGDTATGMTIETGNTTKISGGTSAELGRFVWNVRTNFLFLPPPEGRICIDQATRCVLELATTPADSIGGVAGWILLEELV